jgi:hypothetical protein
VLLKFLGYGSLAQLNKVPCAGRLLSAWYVAVDVDEVRLDYVSELLPPTSLLFITQMIYEHGEPRWDNTDRGKPVSVPHCPPQIKRLV